MAVATAPSLLLMLLMKVMIVMSQKPTITRNSDNIVTCQNELIEYSCTVNSTRAQWVASPFVSASDAIIFSTEGTPRTFEIPDDDNIIIIRFVQFSRNPFITVMLVNGKLLATFNITCIDLVTDVESQPVKYISGAQSSVQPVTVPIATPLSSNSSLGSFEVSYQPSLSPDVQYVVEYCSKDGCWNQTFSGNGGVLTVNCIGVTIVNASIITKNRCDKESTPVLIDEIAINCIDQIIASEIGGTDCYPLEAVIIPSVLGLIFLTVSIILTIVLVVLKNMKSKVRQKAAMESEHIMQQKGAD